MVTRLIVVAVFLSRWTFSQASLLVPHIRFNDGVEEVGKSCSADEWTVISESVNAKRSSLGLSNKGNQRIRFGELESHGECASFVRDGRQSPTRTTNKRPVGNTAVVRSLRGRHAAAINDDQCGVDLVRVEASLKSILPRLSPSCKALVKSSIDVNCVKRVECEIAHFSLWNAKTNSAIVDDFPSSGGSVCRNTTVVFQAVTSFDLGKVQFSWTGPMGQKTTYTQLQSPYRISGNTNVNLFGMNYPYGNFTLTASAIDKASSAKTINFKVIKC